MANANPLLLTYDRGTLLLNSPPSVEAATLPGVRHDPRTGTFRAEGRYYRAIVEQCIRGQIAYEDQARNWPNAPAGLVLKIEREPFPHQREALEAWLPSRRGCVILPTGTGKTFVAILAIAQVNRPTLVIAPTLDLMRQWHGQLEAFFGITAGVVGGGDHNWLPITVTTYDSALIHAEHWANRFGMLVFDECHHLPGPSYRAAAIAALAPFRLGLTATPERTDGAEADLPNLVGPIVYRREIQELSGDYLAGYETRRVYVDLTDEERRRYLHNRETYRRFLFASGVNLGTANGWQRFVLEAGQTPEGREALRAWRAMKQIERAGAGKFKELDRLLALHARERILIFTADNATVHEIARRHLVPAITHQTKVRERRAILARFHSGEYTVCVTSQVLNEGVDVPAAAVGIVLSGSGSTRENVQRLGRILRKHGNKKAILYEIVTRNTGEETTSDRRRQHGAFGSEPL